jgi:hypothetical protein
MNSEGKWFIACFGLICGVAGMIGWLLPVNEEAMIEVVEPIQYKVVEKVFISKHSPEDRKYKVYDQDGDWWIWIPNRSGMIRYYEEGDTL